MNNIHNDMRLSYIERFTVSKKSYDAYLEELSSIIPEYMDKYHKTGLIPTESDNNAVYVNEKIIPNIYDGKISPKPRVRDLLSGKTVEFIDGTKETFDSIIFCTGYEMPDYSFIENFDIKDLYEHFIYYKDTSLGFVNPPVGTHGVGAAFPYFEVVSDWVVKAILKYEVVPRREVMHTWCQKNMQNLEHKRFYDAWLETIRLAQISGLIPTPETDFRAFWRILTSPTIPDVFNEDWQSRNIRKTQINIDKIKLHFIASLKNSFQSQLIINNILDKDIVNYANSCPQINL